MTDAESLNATGLTVAERYQFDHCRALVIRRDVTDAERRTALRRIAALTAVMQKRIFPHLG